jgi:hypothetical protein
MAVRSDLDDEMQHARWLVLDVVASQCLSTHAGFNATYYRPNLRSLLNREGQLNKQGTMQ